MRILARVLRRDLRLEPQSDQDAHEQMSKEMPDEYVRAFFSFYADGTLDESRVAAGRRADPPAAAPVTSRAGPHAHAAAFR